MARRVHRAWRTMTGRRQGIAAVARVVRTAGARLLAAALPVVAAGTQAAGQPAAVHYVYDDLNRLSAVVNQQGDVAVYRYDAVGNLLRIERVDADGLPGAVAISYFTPALGPAGTIVQVFGKGFGATPGQNTLTFNGTPAVITAAAPNRLLAAVPAGATTGPIDVRAPLGRGASAAPFVVVGVLAVAPAITDVQVGLTRQFVATEDGAPTSGVRWSVNGIAGGESGVGTIGADGLYTAPGVVPVPPAVTITVAHQEDASLGASAQAIILEAGPRFGAAAAVGVAFAAPPATPLAAAPAVSLTVAPLAPATPASSALVSLGVEPVVVALSPASAAAGSRFTLTVVGAGLAGATGITFLRDDFADPTITAGNVTPSGDGTAVIAEVTIAAAAPPGGRVIRVTTPAAGSTAAPTSSNVFTVQ